MNRIFKYVFIIGFFYISSCSQNRSVKQDKVLLPKVNTISPILGKIKEKVQLNGRIIYLNKTMITAPISGYVTLVNAHIGDYVNKGDLIFKIQTSENKALQTLKDSKLNEYGKISLYASTSGYISSLDISEAGVYVTEGIAMTTIIKSKDLIIQVNSPYEYSEILAKNKSIEIELPDKSILTAYYYKTIPMVNPASQTLKVYFKLKDYKLLPQNLNVIVNFTIQNHTNSILLPKGAVLTNETEDEFWIMKTDSDSLAIKIPIEKGLEENGRIEILRPVLQLSDRVIIKGAYGLADSTKVKVE